MRPSNAPAQSLVRAHFYSQLATLLKAGLPVLQTLEHLARNPPHPSLRIPVATLLGALRSGRTFTESFRCLGPPVPAFDIALIDAGEQAGRLDQTFALLSRYHSERAANTRTVLTGCLYPAFVLHVAIFIVPLPQFFRDGSLTAYLVQSLGLLVLLHAGVGLAWWALQGERPDAWRARIESLVLLIPLLGSARADLALARLAGALEALVTAGVLVTDAWPLAAAASGSPLLQRTVGSWKPHLDAGGAPGDPLGKSAIFPELFASTYQTGELSGRLDEQLLWLARHYEEEGFRKLRLLATLAPKLLYGFIAFWVAVQILNLARGYRSLIEDLLAD